MSDTEALADLLAERDTLRADVRELVEAISDALNEWDHRIVFGGDVEAMAGATETAMVPLRALLAKHKEASNGK